jgi:hypothetical protein
MTYENVSKNISKNPDPQKDGLLEDDITHPKERQINLNRPPKSLVDWLVRVHLRLMALENEKANDSS